jgi:hypothetical protein
MVPLLNQCSPAANSGAAVIAAVPRCDLAMTTSHVEFLMDRHGYVRALWLPQETAASTDVQSLVQLVGQLAKRQRHSLTVSHGVFPFHGAVNVRRHGRSSFDYKKSMPKTTLAAWLRGHAAHGTSRIVASKQQRRQHDNPRPSMRVGPTRATRTTTANSTPSPNDVNVRDDRSLGIFRARMHHC